MGTEGMLCVKMCCTIQAGRTANLWRGAGACGSMFFEVPGWQVGRPVSEEEVLAQRKAENAASSSGKKRKMVTFEGAKDASARKPKASKTPKSSLPHQPRAQASSLGAVSKGSRAGKKTPGDPALDKLKAKLSGSRFRFLNQRLYECSSAEALQYFTANESDFLRYHEGFREQTLKWPTNPVDIFIDRLAGMKQAKKGPFVVADMGCGEGKLGLLASRQADQGLLVHSYDLVSVAPHIRVASMTDVPLKDGSVDLAIFSLSLMNTDFGDALREANRILRKGGEVWVAEVESRFEGGKSGVGGFVDSLRNLGFALKGSADFSHKVFVLMDFVKKGQPSGDASSVSLKPCKYKKR